MIKFTTEQGLGSEHQAQGPNITDWVSLLKCNHICQNSMTYLGTNLFHDFMTDILHEIGCCLWKTQLYREIPRFSVNFHQFRSIYEDFLPSCS